MKDDKKDDNILFECEADSEEAAKALAMSYIMGIGASKEADIVRPAITFREVFNSLILPCIFIGVNLIVYFLILNILWCVLVNCAIVLILFTKPFFIFMVHIYQKIAPATLRKSCRFEPSCSEYMLLAIEKYGFVVGFVKGIGRLMRCHYPNGGKDYP